MTKPKDVAKLTKQLEYCREKLRSRGQMWGLIYGFLVVIAYLSITYCIISLAMVGVNTLVTNERGWQSVCDVLIWGFGICYVVFNLPVYLIYRADILNDFAIGAEILHKKITAATSAWRNA
jgi:hypothetical protein